MTSTSTQLQCDFYRKMYELSQQTGAEADIKKNKLQEIVDSLEGVFDEHWGPTMELMSVIPFKGPTIEGITCPHTTKFFLDSGNLTGLYKQIVFLYLKKDPNHCDGYVKKVDFNEAGDALVNAENVACFDTTTPYGNDINPNNLRSVSSSEESNSLIIESYERSNMISKIPTPTHGFHGEAVHIAPRRISQNSHCRYNAPFMFTACLFNQVKTRYYNDLHKTMTHRILLRYDMFMAQWRKIVARFNSAGFKPIPSCGSHYYINRTTIKLTKNEIIALLGATLAHAAKCYEGIVERKCATVKQESKSAYENLEPMVGGFTVCKMDIRKAFMVTPIPVKYQNLWAFPIVLDKDVHLYYSRAIPIGVVGAVALFESVMERVLINKCIVDSIHIRVDDVLVWGKTQADCMENTLKAIDALDEYYFINHSKVAMSDDTIEFFAKKYNLKQDFVEPVASCKTIRMKHNIV